MAHIVTRTHIEDIASLAMVQDIHTHSTMQNIHKGKQCLLQLYLNSQLSLIHALYGLYPVPSINISPYKTLLLNQIELANIE